MNIWDKEDRVSAMSELASALQILLMCEGMIEEARSIGEVKKTLSKRYMDMLYKPSACELTIRDHQ